jgi:hypothetical protein
MQREFLPEILKGGASSMEAVKVGGGWNGLRIVAFIGLQYYWRLAFRFLLFQNVLIVMQDEGQ